MGFVTDFAFGPNAETEFADVSPGFTEIISSGLFVHVWIYDGLFTGFRKK